MNQAQFEQMMQNPQMQQQAMQAMRGLKPAQILDQQIATNPQTMSNPLVKTVMEKRRNHDTAGLKGLAENVFSENGQNYSEFENQMKNFLGTN